MIPVLDFKNRPIPNKFKATKADELLAPYDYDLAVTIITEEGNELVIPVWRFIEMYCRIKDRNGRFCAFEINDAQIEFYKELCEQKRKGQPMRVDILKARQLGFSTFIASVIFVLTILVPNQTACIIADTAEHATNLFNKYKFYYANMPDFIKKKLPTVASNAKQLVVDYGNGQTSTVRVLVQGENAGRSDTCQYLHLSEVAFWQNIEDTTTSVLQTVDDNNPNSIIAYETTANGVNYYKTVWDSDFAGGTGYRALFFAWYLDPKNVAKYDGFELFEWEMKLMQKHNLSLEQIAWYRGQYNKMRGNLAKLRQEFPSSPIEAFIVTGSNVFNIELLLERKAEIMNEKIVKQGFFSFKKAVNIDGSQINITNERFIESGTGEIKIYELPKEGHPYVVSNDPAMGGEDYFATQVVDNYTGNQVAVYHKNKCDADDCAFQMYCLARYYNNALVTGETNTTSYLLKLIYKCGYRFIYQDQDYEALAGRFQDKFGFKTKTTNRQAMIEQFAEAFRDNPTIIKDYETICEMEAFQVVRSENGKEKAQATAGKHDDLVMSMCGYYLCRHAQKAILSSSNTSSAKKSVAQLEWEQEEKMRTNNRNNGRRVYQIWD